MVMIRRAFEPGTRCAGPSRYVTSAIPASPPEAFTAQSSDRKGWSSEHGDDRIHRRIGTDGPRHGEEPARQGALAGLTVHRNRERVADLLAAGATAGGARRRRWPQARDIVFLCVTGSPQVEAAIEGPNGLLAGAPRGLVVVDCSTSEPDSTARLRGVCAAAGVTLRRRAARAHAGRGRARQAQRDGRRRAGDLRALEPVLRGFAENVFHVGGPGAGHIIKLLNNFIAQAICTATAEAFAVGAARRRRPAASWSR